MTPTTAAILFIVFNRPDLARRVFVSIRAARPRRLYIAADGPRPTRPGEKALCDDTRSIVEEVDWPCDVQTLFRAENLGCRRAVSGALDWFFGQEPDGIVLEDDCLPDPTFFPFCAELLDRYRDDPRVMSIGGDNTVRARLPGRASYAFTAMPLIWGWATWARAWAAYDFDAFRAADRDRVIAAHTALPHEQAFWRETFDRVAQEKLSSWAYVWTYTLMWMQGQAILPRTNLISNIGFGETGTHTRNVRSHRAAAATSPVSLPLSHPTVRRIDPRFECAVMADVQGVRPTPHLTRRALRYVHRRLTAFGAEA